MSTHALIQEYPEFALAAAAISTGQFVHNAALIANYLEPPGEERYTLQRRVAKLHALASGDTRSIDLRLVAGGAD